MIVPHSVDVRDIASLNSDEVWRMYGRYKVKFDDGVEKEMSGRHIKLSWPYWGITRLYPRVPIPSTLCVEKGKFTSDGLHLDLMSEAGLLARQHGVDMNDVRFLLCQSVYADAFNLTVKHLLSYATTIDYDTMIEIYRHPDYQLIKTWAKEYPTGYDSDGHDMVEEAYKVIEGIVHDPALRMNPLVMSVLDHTMKLNQVLQAYVRGKMSEIDSRVFSIQVWEGVFTGLDSIASRIKEANAASRSHLYNTDKIAEAEYGSRKLQLVANVLMHFSLEDCGTKHFHRKTFHDTREDKAAFKAMNGMYYRLEGETEYRRMYPNDFESIVGKPIEFRSAMTCEFLKHQTICAKCMGDLIYNLSPGTSPGHLASTSISEKGTQGILSTKHLDFLRYLLNLVITNKMAEYVEEYKHMSTKGICLCKQPIVGQWKEYSLIVSDKVYTELSQISYYDSISDVDETTLPEISDLTFYSEDAEGNVRTNESIDVRVGICGNFSKPFLRYFRDVKADVVWMSKKMVRIPLSGWNVKQPIIVYTNKSESMAEFIAGLETKIRSVAADKEDYQELINTEASAKMSKKGKVKPITLVQLGGGTESQCTFALFDMYRYINRKLSGIPMTHVAIMLAVSRVESIDNPFPAVGFDEVSTPRGKRFVNHDWLIQARSAVPMFFFEGQQNGVDNICFYTVRKRPASLYDGAMVALEE